MHFVASVLGFRVSGTDIRYDVPLTLHEPARRHDRVVCAGVFAGRLRPVSAAEHSCSADSLTGLGVATCTTSAWRPCACTGDVS